MSHATILSVRVAPAGDPAPPASRSLSVCAPLPSSTSALRFVRGEPGAWLLLVRDWVARGGLIGLGLAAAGLRAPFWRFARYALGGSGAIEVFCVAYVWWEERERRRGLAALTQDPVASPPGTTARRAA
jgi:hypothetical protein